MLVAPTARLARTLKFWLRQPSRALSLVPNSKGTIGGLSTPLPPSQPDNQGIEDRQGSEPKVGDRARRYTWYPMKMSRKPIIQG